jgi:hypothetical protein
MEFFRVRLILALIAGVTLVSLGSTYFDVLAHKHALRQELERQTDLVGAGRKQGGRHHRGSEAAATGL